MLPIADFANYVHPGVVDILAPADVIVVQRNLLTADIWEACDYWRGLGKLVLADLDDDYPHLTPQNPAFPFWILDVTKIKERTGYTPIEALTEGFKHVDGLLSPNELILQDWSDVLGGYWQPNYAHWPWYKGMKQKPLPADDEQIIVGWGGSVSHWDSWWFSGLRKAVPELSKQYPRITWKICGGDVRVKRFFDDIAPGRWIDQAGVPPQEWPKQVQSFDIGLAPLCGPEYEQGERYDKRRSWLKAVEYLLTGVPWIGSDGIVYEKLDGQGGFVVENSPETWADGLRRVLDNLSDYKAESKRLMRWARDNVAMEHVVEKYTQVFANAMVDRNAEHGVRLPNVIYSKDIKVDDADEIGAVDIVIHEAEDMEELRRWQRMTFDLSEHWHDGLTLEYAGVNLPKCIQYPLLQAVNELTYQALEAEQEDSDEN